MDFLLALEWSAFILGAVTVWRYGYSKKQGAVLGVITAATFIFWGFAGGLYGALTINLGFFALHANNLRIAIREEQNV